MAKETLIVFVYDTECLKDEGDDPVNAVLYFHPGWVSSTQKVALCGQLMGTSFFLKNCFFRSRIISLQNGKFVLKEFGRFILAVGTDRNISDQYLLARADLLCALLKLFHRDLRTIYEQYTAAQQWKNLSERLYQIFETYLPILQCNGNIFFNVPKLRMPKAGSNIFLDAIQTLQCCQQTCGILGGTILYHNKVVVSQLSDALTAQLTLANPIHIRTTAEQIHSNAFHIPNGVQIIVIYIDEEQYDRLSADASRAQNLQTMQLLHPFQFGKRKMKRDRSLIFTNIPEENSSVEKTVGEKPDLSKPQTSRPNHLPLRLKSVNTKELPESGIASINFDETDSYPEFIGRTSVCSTPMTENKVLQVGNVMSICANPEENIQPNTKRSSLKVDIDKFLQHFLNITPKNVERRNSLDELQESLKKFTRRLSLNNYTNTTKTDLNRNSNDIDTLDYIENGDEEDCASDNSELNNELRSTILVDPGNKSMSRGVFQEFLRKYYKLKVTENNTRNDKEIVELMEEFKEFDHELKKIDEFLLNESTTNTDHINQPDRNLNINEISTETISKSTLNRKSLCLPIKPLSDTDNIMPISTRKSSGAIPLTPLMAKLSVLALNEEFTTSGWDTDGGQTPNAAGNGITKRTKNELKNDDVQNFPQNNNNESQLKRVELYMCGQQNMTLLLLMEEGSAQKHSIIQKMFEICVAKFPHMESQLNQTLNINVNGDKNEGNYSLLRIDSKWDAIQSIGPWNFVELNTIESMHQELQGNVTIKDIILRTNDNIFYGYKLANTEFYYKEPVHSIAGIPPPSDPIGNVTAHAKTRLERDHSYIFF